MTGALESQRVAFLAQFRSDQRNRVVAPLAEYLTTYPGIQGDVIAAFAGHHRALAEPEQGWETESSDPKGRLVGPYELQRVLGRGGQGVVWLAQDVRMGRSVALKVLPLPHGTEQLPPRFEREVQATASLEHPAFCAVYGVGAEAGAAWLAMRLVEGQPIDEWVRELGEEREQRVAGLFAALGHALDHAHARGIVHRDLKPSNILVEPGDVPVVLDLGIAHLSAAAGVLTRTGDTLGTPGYMAPETLRRGGGTPGPQVDVWGLGVCLYECLSDTRPFDASSRDAVLRAVMDVEPPRLETLGIKSDLATVVRTAIAKEPDRRYSSARALAEDLERYGRGEAVLARDISAFGKLVRWARRNRALTLAATLTVLTLSVAAIYSYVQYRAARASLSIQNGLISEVDRTSDALTARELLSSAGEMWPIHPDLVERLDPWLSDASRLFEREPVYAKLRARILRRVASAKGLGRSEEERSRDQWILSELEDLESAIGRLREPYRALADRRSAAASLYRVTVTSYASEWQRVARAVALDGRFGGLMVSPQIGLVPLGPDRSSGFEEFALHSSGEVPVRDPDSGSLVLHDDTAIVLVLLPGGTFLMGAERPESPDPRMPERIDPGVKSFESGLLRRDFVPFLMSKFELSQRQWQAHTGNNPSQHQSSEAVTPRRPVEQVSYAECVQVLGQLGLEVPSEGRWEYAARGGTQSVWYCGNDIASLNGHVNIWDRSVREHFARAGRTLRDAVVEEVHDACILTNAIGSYSPNPFGLHDVMGNVQELTSTGFMWGNEDPRREPGDDPGDPIFMVFRGGACMTLPTHCRLAARMSQAIEQRDGQVGVRPMRRLVVRSDDE